MQKSKKLMEKNWSKTKKSSPLIVKKNTRPPPYWETARNAKCPIFLGNFTPKTSNYCLKNRALGFPGGFFGGLAQPKVASTGPSDHRDVRQGPKGVTDAVDEMPQALGILWSLDVVPRPGWVGLLGSKGE